MQVITVPNIMQPEKSFKTDHEHTSVIEYLQFQYPDGFKVPHVIYRNNNRLEVEDYDIACGRDDFIVIAFSPAVPVAGLVGWQLFAAYAANFAISAAASYVVGEIFKPNIPKGVLTSDQKTDAANVSSVYNLSSGQNKVSLGQPIPSLYGRTRVYPSLVEKPYFRFQENDMYLYQMMAISVGDIAIDELLVSETPETDLSPDDIVSRTFKKEDFINGDIEGNIASSFNDNNYHMRVNTLPEISGLELRGTPSNSKMTVKFENSDITFHKDKNDNLPDISSLVPSSVITVNGTVNNDGEHTVVSIVDNVVTTGTIFTSDPNGITTTFSGISEGSFYYEDVQIRVGLPVPTWYNTILNGDAISIGSVISDGVIYNKGSVYHYDDSVGIEYDRYYFSLSQPSNNNFSEDILTINFREYEMEFETSYGSYILENIPSALDSIEIDVEFPVGIYNSDTSGNFTDRTILLEYKLIGSNETLWIDLNDNDETWTEQGRTNTPQRRTYSLPIPSGLTDDVPLKIRLRRSSPEVADIKSQDEAVVTRIKSIYNEPDISGYGDITLLWCRIKATNAISSAGQFQINAWATRTDVEPDLTSVITDLYTNTDYGAGLSASDLVLPEMNIIPPNTIDTDTDTGYVPIDTGVGTETYYGIDSSGLPCPPGSQKVTVFWDGVKVLDGVCVDTTDTSIGGYSPTLPYYSDIDGWYYLVETFPDTFFNPVKVRRYKYLDVVYWPVFNGAIDSKITVMDALRMVGKAGRYNVYLDGQNVTMKKDDVQLIRTALFNETNILKDTFKLDYLFGEDDGYDGISVKYRDPINFKESIATYPSGAINPEVTELIGCTDFDIALKEATYGWLQKESRRKIATFSTDIQGIIPNYLDRIGITHNVPEWGQSGQIVEVIGNQITIDCQLFYFSDEIGSCDDEFGACDDTFCRKVPENIDYNTIIFRKNDGSVSDLYAFTIIDERTILLDETPPTWLYIGYDYDNTFFSVGVSVKFIKDYIVTEIQPRGNNVIDVKCINYDETVYDAPYLVDGAGANLTDGAGNYLTQ